MGSRAAWWMTGWVVTLAACGALDEDGRRKTGPDGSLGTGPGELTETSSPSGVVDTGTPPTTGTGTEQETWTIPTGSDATHPDEPLGDVYVSSTILVQLEPGVSEEQFTLRTGLTMGPLAWSDWHLVRVPSDRTAFELTAELARSDLVECAARVARIEGAGGTMEGRASPYQWHLASAHAPLAGANRDALSTLRVAVLDTGVAYEHHQDTEQAYAQAASLQHVTFVEPYDFVNDDAHANDDHQHGTHIASLIGSQGDVEGVAPGVQIIPIKVLDENNQGTELTLLRGLQHAIDHGADVINLSLSFPLGYVPTPALESLLQQAHDAGIVMVAAAGNAGADEVTWPAASRLVIAVGAGAPPLDEDDPEQWDPVPLMEADYSNLSNAIDVVAPGGGLAADNTGDGLVDGMVAETILPGNPSQTGLWMFAGTSQAAAVVSGAVAHLLASGVEPERVAEVLHWSARRHGLGRATYVEGVGAGILDLEAALRVAEAGTPAWVPEYAVGILPYFNNFWGWVLPAARVWVTDHGNVVQDDVIVTGTAVSDEGVESVSCTVAAGDSFCTLWGELRWTNHAAYRFTVDGVVRDDAVYRPTPAMFATDAAEALYAAVDADQGMSGATVAFRFDSGYDDHLGWMYEGWVIHNLGTGPTAAPSAMAIQPGALDWTVEDVQVDMDGSGLLSSPFGLLPARLARFGGGTFVGFDGTSLEQTALELHPTDVFGPGSTAGTGLLSSPLGLRGEIMDLGRRWSPARLGTSLLGASLDGEGFRLQSGAAPLDGLMGSGAVSLDVGDAALEGSGAGSAPLE